MATQVIHLALDCRAIGSVQGTVTLPPAGAATWTIAASLYPDLTTLAAAIQTAVRTATSDAAWTCALTGTGEAGMVIAHAGDTFSATFPGILRTHAGFSATYTSVTSAASSATPIGWWPTLPVADPDVYYIHRRLWDQGDNIRLDPIGVMLATQPRFTCVLQYETGDVAQLRTLLGYALAGDQFRLFLNWADQTAWTESNRDGYLDLRMVDSSAAESWMNEPVATFGSIPLDARWVNYS